MMTALYIGIPVLLILAVALGVLTLSPDVPPAPEERKPRPTAARWATLAVQPHKPELTGEQAVALVEERLGHERQVAQRFARDPSPENLWLN